jgi:hypothetical protein
VVKHFPLFIEHKGSLPISQEPAMGQLANNCETKKPAIYSILAEFTETKSLPTFKKQNYYG